MYSRVLADVKIINLNLIVTTKRVDEVIIITSVLYGYTKNKTERCNGHALSGIRSSNLSHGKFLVKSLVLL
jgi:hypothetical protein